MSSWFHYVPLDDHPFYVKQGSGNEDHESFWELPAGVNTEDVQEVRVASNWHIHLDQSGIPYKCVSIDDGETWLIYTDVISQQNYYQNPATEESVWQPPHADLVQSIIDVNAALEQEWKKSWAAIKIQSIVREYQCRRRFSTEKDATCCIQAIFRGFKARILDRENRRHLRHEVTSSSQPAVPQGQRLDLKAVDATESSSVVEGVGEHSPSPIVGEVRTAHNWLVYIDQFRTPYKCVRKSGPEESWQICTDKATNHIYFHNAVTGESLWEPPHLDLSHALQKVRQGLRHDAARAWAATKAQAMVRAHQCRRRMSAEKRASRIIQGMFRMHKARCKVEERRRLEAKRRAKAAAPPSTLLVSDSVVHSPSETRTVDSEVISDPVAHSKGGSRADEESGVEHGMHSTEKADPAPNSAEKSEPVRDADEKLEVSDDVDHPADSMPDPLGVVEPIGHKERKSRDNLDEQPMDEPQTNLHPLRATEPTADAEGKPGVEESGVKEDMHPTAHLLQDPMERLEPVSDAKEKSDMYDGMYPFGETEVAFQSLGGADPQVEVEQKSVLIHASDPSRLDGKRAASAPPERSRQGRLGKTSTAILTALDHKEADLEMEPLQDAPRHRINRMALRALYLIGENITKKVSIDDKQIQRRLAAFESTHKRRTTRNSRRRQKPAVKSRYKDPPAKDNLESKQKPTLVLGDFASHIFAKMRPETARRYKRRFLRECANDPDSLLQNIRHTTVKIRYPSPKPKLSRQRRKSTGDLKVTGDLEASDEVPDVSGVISFGPRPPIHLSDPPSKPEANDPGHVDEDLLRLREECTLMPDVPVDDALRMVLEKNRQKQINRLSANASGATRASTPNRVPRGRPSSSPYGSQLSADRNAMHGRLAFSAHKHRRFSRVRRRKIRRPQTAQVRSRRRMPVW